jgi:hypothetical protein
MVLRVRFGCTIGQLSTDLFRRDRWPSTLTRGYGEPHRHHALTIYGVPVLATQLHYLLDSQAGLRSFDN